MLLVDPLQFLAIGIFRGKTGWLDVQKDGLKGKPWKNRMGNIEKSEKFFIPLKSMDVEQESSRSIGDISRMASPFRQLP